MPVFVTEPELKQFLIAVMPADELPVAEPAIPPTKSPQPLISPLLLQFIIELPPVVPATIPPIYPFLSEVTFALFVQFSIVTGDPMPTIQAA